MSGSDSKSDTVPYLAASFFTENLFSSDPTILVDEIDPILEDFEAGGVMSEVFDKKELSWPT